MLAAQTQSALNAASTKVRGGYSGGYYINGVYVVPVTTKPFNTYLIYGTETPCNPYNNNSIPNYPIYPNCNVVTTRIVKVAWTTTTVRTVYVYLNTGGRVTVRGGRSMYIGLAVFLAGAIAVRLH